MCSEKSVCALIIYRDILSGIIEVKHQVTFSDKLTYSTTYIFKWYSFSTENSFSDFLFTKNHTYYFFQAISSLYKDIKLLQ